MRALEKLQEWRLKLALRLDKRAFQREFCRKAILSYPPRYATIGIGSACNNRCAFCAYHSDDAKGGASNVYGLTFSISLNDFKRIVNMCHAGRVPRIHICATGEPFLHSDILPMIDYVIGVYGSVSVQTNFFRKIFEKNNYLDEIVRRASHISYITTDLLSGDPAEHEALKRGSKLEDVMSAMQYLSCRSAIRFEVHYILTKYNYQHLDLLIQELSRRGIRCRVAIVNLHPHGFNAYTALEATYTSRDVSISRALQQAGILGRSKGISVQIPHPVDVAPRRCQSFWGRFQTWPVAGIDKNRYGENVIVGGCNAVVLGNLNSLGYVFDYENIMDLWNNESFVRIRSNLLQGIYPDSMCRLCWHHPEFMRDG